MPDLSVCSEETSGVQITCDCDLKPVEKVYFSTPGALLFCLRLKHKAHDDFHSIKASKILMDMSSLKDLPILKLIMCFMT